MTGPVEGRETWGGREQFNKSWRVQREQVRLNRICRQCNRQYQRIAGTNCVSFTPRLTRGILRIYSSTSSPLLLRRISAAVVAVSALRAVDPTSVLAQSTLPAAKIGSANAAGDNRAIACPSGAIWNAPQPPFRIFGNTWFVGTHGLCALLVTSSNGHILVDDGLPESAPLIAANVATLGFRMQDVKLIVNSHDHHDHAGGIAALEALSGAKVVACASSARVLLSGTSEFNDPQFGLTLPFLKVRDVASIRNNQVVRAGDDAITARFTAGHTAGGTSWSWVSGENALA